MRTLKARSAWHPLLSPCKIYSFRLIFDERVDMTFLTLDGIAIRPHPTPGSILHAQHSLPTHTRLSSLYSTQAFQLLSQF